MVPHLSEEMRNNVGKLAKYDGIVWEIKGTVMKSDGYGHYSTDWWEYTLEHSDGFVTLKDTARPHKVEIVERP